VKINLELTEIELKEIVLAKFQEMLGEIPLKKEDVHIQVKSKQNYKSEWEEASFRAIVNRSY
jgi:hypothetical protein